MLIKKDKICIRNAEKADCAQLAAWWNDGRVMAHAGFPLGLNITAEEIEQEISTDTDDTRRRLIIEYKNVPIGEMSYSTITEDDKKNKKVLKIAEIGIKICNPDHQEKGLGRVILSLFIRELFGNGYEKIILDTNKKNTRAQHVYEMLGFRKLRVNENAWTDQLGELQSSVDYELLPEDFIDLSGSAC